MSRFKKLGTPNSVPSPNNPKKMISAREVVEFLVKNNLKGVKIRGIHKVNGKKKIDYVWLKYDD